MEIPEYFSLVCPFDGQTHWFGRRQVYATTDSNPTAGLAVLGGLIGLFGGGWGLAIGAAIGAGAGSIVQKQDADSAAAFNNS